MKNASVRILKWAYTAEVRFSFACTTRLIWLLRDSQPLLSDSRSKNASLIFHRVTRDTWPVNSTEKVPKRTVGTVRGAPGPSSSTEKKQGKEQWWLQNGCVFKLIVCEYKFRFQRGNITGKHAGIRMGPFKSNGLIFYGFFLWNIVDYAYQYGESNSYSPLIICANKFASLSS